MTYTGITIDGPSCRVVITEQNKLVHLKVKSDLKESWYFEITWQCNPVIAGKAIWLKRQRFQDNFKYSTERLHIEDI